MECKNGKMELSMQESGKMIKLMDLESYCTRMEISTKGNGLMIWLMDQESILMQMEQYMMEIGSKTNKKALERKCGQMERGMKATSKME